MVRRRFAIIVTVTFSNAVAEDPGGPTLGYLNLHLRQVRPPRTVTVPRKCSRGLGGRRKG